MSMGESVFEVVKQSVTAREAAELYGNLLKWQRMSLINIANAGRFSADRAVDEYAKNIWHLK